MYYLCVRNEGLTAEPQSVGANRCVRPASPTPRILRHVSCADTPVCPYGKCNHLGHSQGFKPRIARIAQIILGQHDETDDTDIASGCALAPPG